MLDTCIAQARDAAHSLHAYLRRADLDPEQLAALDDRMGQWMGLARRFRRPPEELSSVLAAWRADLARLAERSMRLQFSIQDGGVWVTNGRDTVQIEPKWLQGGDRS